MTPIVTAVAEPRPDGERIVKAIIELNGTFVDAAQITVKDRTITGCEQDGDIITLCLSEDDEQANVLPKFKKPAGGPGGPGGPKGPKGPGGPGKPKGNGPRIHPKNRRPIEVTADIPGVGEITSSKAVEKVIDRFTQGRYGAFEYNLFTPDLTPGEKYPLVVFIADASANGPDVLVTLSQGIGATVWAEEENQKKHPCYVLAIQIPIEIRLTDDNYNVVPEFDQIKELIDSIAEGNQVDRCRIYMTGQSQGCMATFEMNCRFPDLLAASMCVSGMWDPEKVGRLKNSRIYMGLSSGGLKEFPGMTAIADNLERNGASVARIDLNYRDGWDIINEKIRNESIDANIVLAPFDKETVWDDDSSNHADIEHHSRGWELTYQAEAARDWLFAWKKN